MNDLSGRDDGRSAKRNFLGFLDALRRDVTANTLVMMAIFAIPLAGLAGSAVDMARVYVVKARLQQACDAGVLAGRRVMTQTTGTTLDAAPEAAAQAFFKNNFPAGWMSTTFPTGYSDGAGGGKLVTARSNEGLVSGTASATTPMAIMGMFGVGAVTQTVTCTARLDIGDSDIMFVLDTTGSMACYTGSGCSSETSYTRADGSTGWYRIEQPTTYKTVGGKSVIDKQAKIAALRDAVKLFRTTLENNKPAAAHIRYGFVTYSSATNVGGVIRAASSNYLADTSIYPSRELAINASGESLTSAKIDENPVSDSSKRFYVTRTDYNQGDVNYGPNDTITPVQNTAADTRAKCMALAFNTDGTVAAGSRSSGGVDYQIGTWPAVANPTLTRKLPDWSSSKCMVYTWTVKPMWRYTQVSRDVSTFKLGTSVNDPTKFAASSTKWEGCIVEREMTPATSSTTYDPSSLPADMNPDTMPTTPATKWRPMWPETVYYRSGAAAQYYSGASTSSSSERPSGEVGAATNYTSVMTTQSQEALYYACGAPAKTLSEMSESQFDSYLGTPTTGDFRAFGYTYHDVGMIWGLRLISPDGPWASTTTAWPGNNEPNRYIVFMTDGDLMTRTESYSMFGLNKVEAGAAAVNSTNDTIHTNRFLAVCEAAKAKNIVVFVVQFDNGTTPASDMTSCASDTYAYAAQTPAQLQTAFSRIALEITRLRLSQ